MPYGDPYHPKSPFVYECVRCGIRNRSEHHPGVCGVCGGLLLDVSVARE